MEKKRYAELKHAFDGLVTMTHDLDSVVRQTKSAEYDEWVNITAAKNLITNIQRQADVYAAELDANRQSLEHCRRQLTQHKNREHDYICRIQQLENSVKTPCSLISFQEKRVKECENQIIKLEKSNGELKADYTHMKQKFEESIFNSDSLQQQLNSSNDRCQEMEFQLQKSEKENQQLQESILQMSQIFSEYETSCQSSLISLKSELGVLKQSALKGLEDTRALSIQYQPILYSVQNLHIGISNRMRSIESKWISDAERVKALAREKEISCNEFITMFTKKKERKINDEFEWRSKVLKQFEELSVSTQWWSLNKASKRLADKPQRRYARIVVSPQIIDSLKIEIDHYLNHNKTSFLQSEFNMKNALKDGLRNNFAASSHTQNSNKLSLKPNNASNSHFPRSEIQWTSSASITKSKLDPSSNFNPPSRIRRLPLEEVRALLVGWQSPGWQNLLRSNKVESDDNPSLWVSCVTSDRSFDFKCDDKDQAENLSFVLSYCLSLGSGCVRKGTENRRQFIIERAKNALWAHWTKISLKEGNRGLYTIAAREIRSGLNSFRVLQTSKEKNSTERRRFIQEIAMGDNLRVGKSASLSTWSFAKSPVVYRPQEENFNAKAGTIRSVNSPTNNKTIWSTEWSHHHTYQPSSLVTPSHTSPKILQLKSNYSEKENIKSLKRFRKKLGIIELGSNSGDEIFNTSDDERCFHTASPNFRENTSSKGKRKKKKKPPKENLPIPSEDIDTKMETQISQRLSNTLKQTGDMNKTNTTFIDPFIEDDTIETDPNKKEHNNKKEKNKVSLTAKIAQSLLSAFKI